MSSVLSWLLAWTAIGVIWWTIAVVLVWRRRMPETNRETARDRERITVFKPISSPLDATEYATVERCLGTLLADVDEDCEVLIGANEPEAASLERFVARMRADYPGVRIELVVEPVQDTLMHPKVFWNRRLSEHATGHWWFWSDADIFVPRGTFAALRQDFTPGNGMVTSPYVVTQVGTAADLLEALYVNLEFNPGVELLGRFGALANGLGAGMLFSADEFRRKVDWNEFGSHLADDFVLGQLLAPVRLGSVTLQTMPTGGGWRAALLHYLRCQKTVRWCRSGGFAAQIIVLPVIGWLIWLFSAPASVVAWSGLAAVLALDLMASLIVCRRVGCRFEAAQLTVIPLWSLLRGVVWIACWFPWPVVWNGRRWWSPRLYEPKTVIRSSEVAD